MKAKLPVLLRLELRGLWGMNKYRHSRDSAYRGRWRLLLGVWCLLAVMAVFYVGALVWGLCQLGLSGLVPAYLVTVSSLLLFAMNFFGGTGALFHRQGYDLLTALPVKTEAVVLSRFLVLYFQDLLVTAAVLLSGGAVYAWCVRPGWLFYPVWLAGLVFLPGMPLALAAALGTAIAAVSSRMRGKTMAQTVLTLALVILILVGSLFLSGSDGELDMTQLADLAGSLGGKMAALWPPAGWLGEAADGSVGMLLLFAGVSLAASAALLAWVSRSYHGICRRLWAASARHDYRMGALKHRGLTAALYRREAKRYFASTIYVTNTIIGPIMGCILSGAVLAVGLEELQAAVPVDIRGPLPFLVGAVFAMMPPSSVAVSMEGKEFWIIRTLPVPVKAWLDSKLLLTLSLAGPCWLLSELLLFIALEPRGLELLWLVLIPAACILFSAVFGLGVDLKLHRFDWEKEGTAVKQSASAGLGGLGAALAPMVCCGVAAAAPEGWENPIRGGLCLLLLGAAALLYVGCQRVSMEKL